MANKVRAAAVAKMISLPVSKIQEMAIFGKLSEVS